MMMQIKLSKLSNGSKRASKRPTGKRSEKNNKAQHIAGQPNVEKYTKPTHIDSKNKKPVKNKYMCYSIYLHEFLKKNGLTTIGEMRHPKTGRTAFIYNKDEKLNRLLDTWSANRSEPDTNEPIEKWIIKEDKKGKLEDKKDHSAKRNRKNKGDY